MTYNVLLFKRCLFQQIYNIKNMFFATGTSKVSIKALFFFLLLSISKSKGRTLSKLNLHFKWVKIVTFVKFGCQPNVLKLLIAKSFPIF